MKSKLELLYIFGLCFLLSLFGSNVFSQSKTGQSGFSQGSAGEMDVFEPAPRTFNSKRTFITHSSSQNIVPGGSIACTTGPPENYLYMENGFYRAFNLPSFGIINEFKVLSVEIGIQEAFGLSGSQPLSVLLYVSSGASFPGGSLTLIGAANFTIQNQSFSIVSFPVSGIAPAGSELVVQIRVPDGRLPVGNRFFIGANSSAQTGPSYLRAPGCNTPNPVTTAALGFGHVHYVMNVIGLEVIPSKIFAASLGGFQQAPPNSSQATGSGTFSLNSDSTELTYEVMIDRTGLIGNLTAAHFHNAPFGKNGPVVKPIIFVGNTASGVWSNSDPDPLTPALVEALLSGNIYVNVHTDSFPGGEIRGQVLDTSLVTANPPQNLMSHRDENGVDLWWDAPLPPGITQLAYEDGPDQTIGGVGFSLELAARFTPKVYPSTLLGIRVYWGIFNLGNDENNVEYSIWTDSLGLDQGPVVQVVPNTPYTVTDRPAFDDIYISDLGININAGDFYYSLIQTDTIAYALGLDSNSPNASRSWISLDGGVNWSKLEDPPVNFPANLVIRALVLEGTGPDARIVELEPAGVNANPMSITELKQLLSQNQDRITIGPNHLEYHQTISGSNNQRSPGVVSENAGLLGFKVYRSEDGDNFSPLASVDPGMLNYNDNSAVNGVTYYYYVTANYDNDESDPSNTVEASQEDLRIHETPELLTGVTNEGTIGMLNFWGGSPGFEWPVGTNQLFEAAIVVGIPNDHVVDAARVIEPSGSQNLLDGDFQFLDFMSVEDTSADATVYQAIYDDSRAVQPPLAGDGPNMPIGLDIRQTSYSYSDPANSGYVILKLEITNNSGTQLDNLLVGMYQDWDVFQFDKNTGKVVFDTLTVPGLNNDFPFEAEFVYQWDSTNAAAYLGAVPLSQNFFRASRIVDNCRENFPPPGFPPNCVPLADGYTEAAKYDYMVNRRADSSFADPFGAGDKSIVVGLGGGTPGGLHPDPGFTVPAGGTITVGIAMVGGNDTTDFLENGKAAIRKWVELGNDMIVLDSVIVGIDDEPLSEIPSEFVLLQNYPNPFNPVTTIQYTLKDPADVELKIYNLLGQEVRILVNQRQSAGYKAVLWDGTDEAGEKVSSGIYIYKIEANGFVQSRKMILLK